MNAPLQALFPQFGGGFENRTFASAKAFLAHAKQAWPELLFLNGRFGFVDQRIAVVRRHPFRVPI